MKIKCKECKNLFDYIVSVGRNPSICSLKCRKTRAKRTSRESSIARDRASRLDHYIVYYLPKEHYCGITGNPKRRMKSHRDKGISTDGWRVLYATKDRTDAIITETRFHLLGMNGHQSLPHVKQN